MKKIVFLIALVFFSTVAFGQKVNFSGTWKLNKEKSELGDQFSMAPNTLILKMNKKTFDSERHAEFQGQEYITNDHFTLDGEVCENPGWMDTIKKSTAGLDKKTKVLTISTTVPIQDGGEVEITEEYVMNGDNLVIEASASSSYGDMTERMVFDKQ